MMIPATIEELVTLVNREGKTVFLFTADWCGDCRFLKPLLPEIEAENPDFTFVEVNRDDYMEVAKKWNIYGIPSLVVLENGQEIGRFVNRERKTKMQINEFLAQLV
ncbi:thioredoxin family protein [Streptococcus constellatus]|uniref:Thioredoxin n=1 Tax=Streptococcus constellatus subsp. constellatus SK53 TaxID=1095730 RepID=A0AAD2Y4P2_STRCV|nr:MULTISPECIES: thioredoxin family protein [Streptococcus anginosus group]EID20550.1 thioredoxin [Streptococcus constellatus subsp. constellatus SK53]MCW0997098.1 thioredoxin family protein [Streptococcus anginosus]MDP1485635.1 thioredoxin family protein [Streptococcus constellatus]QQT04958.1 thioredoxin family protein [Streptococcus constellatus]SUN41281.1 thioredoxin family protein [Streptococcus constellatus]